MKFTAVSGDTVVMLALGAGLGLAAWMVWNRTAGRALDAAASAYESASQVVEQVTAAAAQGAANAPATAGQALTITPLAGAAAGPFGAAAAVIYSAWDVFTRQTSGASGGW